MIVKGQQSHCFIDVSKICFARFNPSQGVVTLELYAYGSRFELEGDAAKEVWKALGAKDTGSRLIGPPPK
jgi:hypothetical protein